MIFSRITNWIIFFIIAINANICFAQSPNIIGYAAHWVPHQIIEKSVGHVDRLIFMEMPISESGAIATDNDEWIMDWASLSKKEYQDQIPIDVALTIFDKKIFEGIFNNTKKIDLLYKDIQKISDSSFIAGIHFDIEIFSEVNEQSKKEYRKFLKKVNFLLKNKIPQKSISIFFNYSAEKYLYNAEILRLFDYIVLQGYDAHWKDGPTAGPVAPLGGKDAVTWEKMLQTAVSMGVNREKILMGFPNYGYEWNIPSCEPRGKRLEPAKTTFFGRIRIPSITDITKNIIDQSIMLGNKYEMDSFSGYYQSQNIGKGCQVGWFEDWWTLQIKIDWVKKESISGIAFFPLGYDDGLLVRFASDQLR